MSLEEKRRIIEDIELGNALERNADMDIEDELTGYSEDISLSEAEEYWRDIYCSVNTDAYNSYLEHIESFTTE